MAQEERVIIRIDIDADVAADVAKVKAALRSMDRDVKKLNTSGRGLGKNLDGISRSTMGATKALSAFGQTFRRVWTLMAKINFIGIAADIGLVSLALASVKVALVAGRFAVKAYEFALKGLGVAAAGVAGAIGTVAAAINEFNQVSLAPFVGGIENAARAVRGVMGDQALSFFGIEGLQGALTELARGGVAVEQSYTGILRSLGNFATDSKQLQQLAQLFATINREGKVTEGTLGSLASINPIFNAALAEAATGRILSGTDAQKVATQAAVSGRLTAASFARALSGELETTDPFEGQLDRLNQTLFGSIKGLIARMAALFTDFGTVFLDPFREAIRDIEQIATFTLIRLRRSVTSFGVDTFIPGIVNAVERLADFTVRMANDALPRLERFAQRTAGIFDSIRNFFTDVAGVLRPLERGAENLIKLFGPLFGRLFGAQGFGGLVQDLADKLEDNEEMVTRFGKSLGDVAFSLMGIFRDFQDFFIDSMPEATAFLDAISHNLLPLIREIFGLFRDLAQDVMPVLTVGIREVSRILTPLVAMLRDLFASSGGLGAAAGLAAFGIGSRAGLGGVFGAVGGAGVAGLPGAILGGMAGRRLGGRAAAGGAGGRLLGKMPAAGFFTRAGAGGYSLFSNGGLVAGGSGLAGGLVGNRIGRGVARGGGGLGGSLGLGGLGGAGAGAATGAAMGLFFGPGGVAAGAVLGGLVGGVAGVLGGALGKKAHDQAMEAAASWSSETVEALTDTLTRDLGGGENRKGLIRATQGLNELLDRQAQLAEELGITQAQALEMIEKATQPFERQIKRRTRELNRNLEELDELFQMNAADVEKLADKLGVDLTDSLTNLFTKAQQLGLIAAPGQVGTTALAQLEEQALQGVLGTGSYLGRREAQAEANRLLRESNALLAEAKGAFDRGDIAGGVAAITPAIESIFTQAQLLYGAEGTELVSLFEDFVKEAMDPNSPTYLGVGFRAAGEEMLKDVQSTKDSILNPDNKVWDPLRVFAKEWGIDFNTLHADVTSVPFAYLGLQVAATGETLDSFNKYMEEGDFKKAGRAIQSTAARFNTGMITFLLNIANAGTALTRGATAYAQRLSGLADYYNAGGGGGTSAPAGTGQTAASLTQNARDYFGVGDTATSRFGSALGFHNTLAGSVGGAFKMTSGMRNYALGSLSSDHATGRAYDLQGDNLGQYGQAVQRLGGFSEFHGRGGSRHLHVVPPIGDSASPAFTGMRGGGGDTYVTMTVVGGDSASPAQIANEVIRKIGRIERDQRERA